MTEFKTFQASMGKPIKKKSFSNFSFKNNWDVIAAATTMLAGAGALAFGLSTSISNDNERADLQPTIICGQGSEGETQAFDLNTGRMLQAQIVQSSSDLLPDSPIDSKGSCLVNGKIGHVVPIEHAHDYIHLNNGS